MLTPARVGCISPNTAHTSLKNIDTSVETKHEVSESHAEHARRQVRNGQSQAQEARLIGAFRRVNFKMAHTSRHAVALFVPAIAGPLHSSGDAEKRSRETVGYKPSRVIQSCLHNVRQDRDPVVTRSQTKSYTRQYFFHNSQRQLADRLRGNETSRTWTYEGICMMMYPT